VKQELPIERVVNVVAWELMVVDDGDDQMGPGQDSEAVIWWYNGMVSPKVGQKCRWDGQRVVDVLRMCGGKGEMRK
jgi:hypothetical protein